MNDKVQAALRARLRPRLKRLGLTLDNALEEYRRLAFAHPGPAFVDVDGELLPVDEWPTADRQTVLEYLRHAGSTVSPTCRPMPSRSTT